MPGQALCRAAGRSAKARADDHAGDRVGAGNCVAALAVIAMATRREDRPLEEGLVIEARAHNLALE